MTFTPFVDGPPPLDASVLNAALASIDTPLATGGTTAVPLVTRFGTLLTPLDFNADPTGVVDSTTALQAFLTYALTGNVVRWARGTYLISSALTGTLALNASCNIVGDGSGLVVLLCSGSGDGIDIIVQNPTNGYRPGALKISGMTIRRTNAATGGNGIFLSGSAPTGAESPIVQISDIRFESLYSPTGMWGKCIYGEGVSNVSLYKINSVQYAIPTTIGDFICINLTSTSYNAGWNLTECYVVGGRYGLWIGGWFQGINLVNCELLSWVPVYWPGNGGNCTMTNGSSSISAKNTFKVGNKAIFNISVGTGGGGVVAGSTYYVVSATSTSFQVSASLGGGAITFNSAASNIYCSDGSSPQGFAASNCYFDGVTTGVLLQNGAAHTISGCQIQVFPTGSPGTFVGLDLNGNGIAISGTLVTGTAGGGWTSIICRMNDAGSSSSGFISFVGCTVGPFDTCFAFENTTTLSIFCGNSGYGNSGSQLFTGTVGTNIVNSLTGPNAINSTTSGSPNYLSFDIGISDGGTIAPVPSQSGVPNLGLAGQVWNQVNANAVLIYNALYGIVGSSGTGGTFEQVYDLFGSGNGSQVQIVYSGGSSGVSNNGTVTINAALTNLSNGSFTVANTVTATNGMIIGGGVTWIDGNGAPTGVVKPKGSLYSRVDGGVGTTLYVSQGGGTWNAVAGV